MPGSRPSEAILGDGQLLADAAHEPFMREALREAEFALARGDRPIGAVVVHAGIVIARAGNARFTGNNNLAHAEIQALWQVADFLTRHAPECTLYTTVEPCVMCLGAIVMANVRRVVFGLHDRHIDPWLMLDHVPYVRAHITDYTGGVLAAASAELMRRFSPAETDLVIGQQSLSAEE